MTKLEYLESQRGNSYTEIIDRQPLTSVIGSIRGDNLRDVVSILAAGLQHRLDEANSSPIKTALEIAFFYLSMPGYSINLSIEENQALLAAAVSCGLVTESESERFYELASYQRPKFNITREDCAQFFGGNQWSEIDAMESTLFWIRLLFAVPEQTYIKIEAQDQYSDGTVSDWYHATAVHGVQSAREYQASLPFNGYPRRLRWRCEYQISAVAGVR